MIFNFLFISKYHSIVYLESIKVRFLNYYMFYLNCINLLLYHVKKIIFTFIHHTTIHTKINSFR